MDQSIDINSGDWKKRNEFMYFSPEKRASYCIKCKLLMPSPRTTSTHAKLHGMTLPYSRKKPKVKIKKPSPENQSIQNVPANVGKIYSYTPPRYGRAYPDELKRRHRQEREARIYLMRYTKCFTEEEIEEAKWTYGLITTEEFLKKRKEFLKKREESRRKKQRDELIQHIIASEPDNARRLSMQINYDVFKEIRSALILDKERGYF